MGNPMEVHEASKYAVTIPTDEYADLIAARTRLDVLIDIVRKQQYSNREDLLLVACATPRVIQRPNNESPVDDPDSIPL